LVRERNVDLITDIIRLKYVEKMEKLDIAKKLSEKYGVNSTTIYRNMEETDTIIKRNIEMLRVLTSADLDKLVFKEEFEKIKKLVE